MGDQTLHQVIGPLENKGHEQFCLSYVAGNDETEAYLRAYPSATRNSARVAAWRLLVKDKIQRRIATLRSKGCEALNRRIEREADKRLEREISKVEIITVVTAATLIAEADAIMRAAMADMQFGPAVSALALKARLAGVLSVDKAGQEAPGRLIDAPPQETYDQWIERRRARMLVAPRGAANGRHSGDVVQ